MTPTLPAAARRRRLACRALAGAAVLCCAAGLPAPAWAGPAADKRVLDADELDARCEAVLARLTARNPGARALVDKASGVLVFPDVLAGGAVAGVEQGDGMMRGAGGDKAYYRLIGASLGAQAGMASRAVVLVFLTGQALERFRASQGWTVGVDGSVSVLSLGIGASVDSNTVRGDIVGFVLTNGGIMISLSLVGTRITRIES
ncbi:YSC84-related protein [Cupriavidus sp. UME77]|uniref:lipid-binding SYLF domain-containing protein n=1 Tax=Cupriavidus sp. UME77 TaxID=1862321 RepID=UPI00160271BE|nr:YSC84-related protein [Cupriavidus sp. UME77]